MVTRLLLITTVGCYMSVHSTVQLLLDPLPRRSSFQCLEDNMELAPPDWLNEEFLEEVLQKEEGRRGKVTVMQFKVNLATTLGDNYASKIFRIHVTFKDDSLHEEKKKSLILKAPINTGVMKEFSEALYDAEPTVYNIILPKMHEKLNIHLGPKMYFCSPQGALVLNDLKDDGFVVCDRFNQLDFPHCKLFYDTLAKYHATSVALHHESPELIEKIGKERSFAVDAAFVDILKPWTKSSLKAFIEVVTETDGECPVIDFLKSKVETIWDSLVYISELKPNKLNVLNHGDTWTNNVMFKHNKNEEIVGIKLIDFQIPRYNSPVFDVIYFFWTSANEDVRQNKEKEVFEVYLRSLNKTLEDVGCEERLTQKQFEEEIKSATDFVIWVVSFVQLFMLCEPELALDLGKYTSEDFSSGVVDEKFRAVYNGKRYRAMVPNVIRDLKTWLISRGFIRQTS